MLRKAKGTGDFVTASLCSVMIAGLIYIGVVLLNTAEKPAIDPVIEGAIRIAQPQEDDPVKPLEHKKLKNPEPPKKIHKTFSSRANHQKKIKPEMEISTPDFSADMHPGLKGGISIPQMELGGIGFEMDEVDEMPQAMRSFPPKYPYGAKRKHVEGKVVVRMLVNSKGSPVNLSIHSSTPAGVFDQAALNAAERWRFRPGKYKGQDVDTWVLLPFNFELTR